MRRSLVQSGLLPGDPGGGLRTFQPGAGDVPSGGQRRSRQKYVPCGNERELIMEKNPMPAAGRGPLAWMAGNSVIANLLMCRLSRGRAHRGIPDQTGGLFPISPMDMVTISVGYPGASPEEVENGIMLWPSKRPSRGWKGSTRSVPRPPKGPPSISVEAVEGARRHPPVAGNQKRGGSHTAPSPTRPMIPRSPSPATSTGS